MQFISIQNTSSSAQNGSKSMLKWSVTEDARKFLTNLHKPVAVVSAVGPYRGGKSYILGCLSGKAKRFETSPSVQPQTRGLWINTELVPDTNVLLMDTEGLNAPKSSISIDTNILALAILFSSKVIFSSIGPINSNSLSDLECAIGTAQLLAKAAVTNASENNGSQQMVSETKPQLVWLLRDFGLQLTDEHKNPMTPTQYLEEALSHSVAVRDALHELFSSRKCIPMVRPVTRDCDLVDMINLVPAFQNDIAVVKNNVFRETVTKKIDGREMTGPSLLAMADALCEVLSRGEIPNLVGVWESTRLAASAEARFQAIEQFSQDMQAQFTPDPKILSWNVEVIHDVLVQTLKNWIQQNKYSKLDDMLMLVDSCLKHVSKSSLAKHEQWIGMLNQSPFTDVLHLLPKVLQPYFTQLQTKCDQLNIELEHKKDQLDEANANIESLEASQEANLFATSNSATEDDLRSANQEVQRNEAQIAAMMDAFNQFKEMSASKHKKLEQTNEDFKIEIDTAKRKEIDFQNKIGELRQQVEVLKKEKDAKTKECDAAQQTIRDNTRDLKEHGKKRKLLETQLQKTSTELSRLIEKKSQYETQVAQLKTEKSEMATKMFRLECMGNGNGQRA